LSWPSRVDYSAALEEEASQKLWLTGDILGWRGPWGTTYPANLRLLASQITEDEWVKRATNSYASGSASGKPSRNLP